MGINNLDVGILLLKIPFFFVMLDGEKQKSSTYKESLKYFMQPETIKPLQMLIIFIFFANVLSGMPYTPYLLSIFETFNAPFQAAWATVSPYR